MNQLEEQLYLSKTSEGTVKKVKKKIKDGEITL